MPDGADHVLANPEGHHGVVTREERRSAATASAHFFSHPYRSGKLSWPTNDIAAPDVSTSVRPRLPVPPAPSSPLPNHDSQRQRIVAAAGFLGKKPLLRCTAYGQAKLRLPQDNAAGLALSLVDRIRALREAAGITQEKLAYESGLRSKGTLSKIEAGRLLPTLSVLDLLARRLGVDLLDLFVLPAQGTRVTT